MSDRSKEWYSVPANAERRKARMRAYGQALSELGRQYPEERRAEYRAGIGLGLSPTAAQNRLNKILRERYPAEFDQLFKDKLRSEMELLADDAATEGPAAVPG